MKFMIVVALFFAVLKVCAENQVCPEQRSEGAGM